MRIQQWFPANCHYCAYKPRHVNDYERHIIKEHQGKMAYLGPTPENLARAIYTAEAIEKELKDINAKTLVVNHNIDETIFR